LLRRGISANPTIPSKGLTKYRENGFDIEGAANPVCGPNAILI